MRGALQGAPGLQKLERALVVGAGGTLGSALLGEALAAGRFQQVKAVVAAPLASAVRGFVPVERAALSRAGVAEVAFVVFERERHSNGRDEVFWSPAPEALIEVARDLHAAGVQRLLVVVPHASALLPHSLKQGFASQAEGEVAALGFEHLVFLRAAQSAGAASAGSRVERFAAWWLSQLRWMVPQAEQPVRAITLAALAVQLARLLPLSAPATRVLPPEVLWQAAQGHAEAVLAGWLGARPGLPAPP